MEEIWKPVLGYENYYLVSSLGRIKSIKTNRLRKLQIHKDGYLCLLLMKDKKVHTKYLHRLIAECFISNPFNYKEVNHINGNKKNNSIANLEWCTHKQNIIHAWKTGLIKYIYKLPSEKNSKLTIEDVRYIRSSSLRNRLLAHRYGVKIKTIRKVKNKETWVNVV